MVRIEYLSDHPEALPKLAEWQHAEWGYLRLGDTLEKRMVRLGGMSKRDCIPLTVVALEENEVLGSASLIEHDMETRMELAPWLAGVFVRSFSLAPDRCRVPTSGWPGQGSAVGRSRCDA